jgi:hypothetical protein
MELPGGRTALDRFVTANGWNVFTYMKSTVASSSQDPDFAVRS